jgi:looped-hinge helix DNA binding domain, AbrB family
MHSTLTQKGQVTIPKYIRDTLHLSQGCAVEFAVNRNGEVVINRAEQPDTSGVNPFAAVRGKADIPWRTDDLMKLLRGDD